MVHLIGIRRGPEGVLKIGVRPNRASGGIRGWVLRWLGLGEVLIADAAD